MSTQKSTLTISELISILQNYPPEMPIFASWEGVLAPIRAIAFNIESSKYDPGRGPQLYKLEVDSLIIDVNDYSD